jgi:hypothetical protein
MGFEGTRQDIPGCLAREEIEEAAVAAYKASKVMERTIDNDFSLFHSAQAAKLVQIKFKITSFRYSSFNANTSAIASWCDGCKRIIGARFKYSTCASSKIPANYVSRTSLISTSMLWVPLCQQS